MKSIIILWRRMICIILIPFSLLMLKCDHKSSEYNRLKDEAFNLRMKQKYSEEEVLWRKLLEMVKTEFKENYDRNTEVRLNLAATYLNQKKYNEAKLEYKVLIDLIKSKGPDGIIKTNSFLLIVSLSRLAAIMEVIGEKEHAQPYYQEALEVCHKIGVVGTYQFYSRELETLKEHFEYHKDNSMVISLQNRINSIQNKFIDKKE